MTGFDLFGSLIELLKDSVNFSLPFTKIDYFQRGVLLRWGNPRMRRKAPKRWLIYKPWKYKKVTREEDCVVGPGFIWHWPFNIDEIIVTNVVFETAPIADLQIETKDGIAINAQPVVGYCIINVRKFLLEVEEATSAVVDVAGGAIVEAVRKKTWEEIKADTEFTRKIRDVVARRANERFGIEIQSMYFHSLVRMGFRHGVLKLAWQQ